MKSNSFTLDTSFIISLLKETDANYKKAMDIYSLMYRSASFFIPTTVLVELLPLNRYIDSDKLDNFLSSIDVEFINLDMKFFSFIKDLYILKKPALSAVDLTVVACAMETRTEIISFDRKLIREFKKIV